MEMTSSQDSWFDSHFTPDICVTLEKSFPPISVCPLPIYKNSTAQLWD